jgi:hypothetical protein
MIVLTETICDSEGVQNTNKSSKFDQNDTPRDKSKSEIQSYMSGEFTVDRELKHGDVLSTQLFNITLEKIMRSIEINRGGTIFNRSLQYLAYADDVNLTSRNTRELSKALIAMESHSTRGHPGVSTPPSQISMKFGIQHLWTNITTHIFYFLHIGSRSVFTAL